MVLFGRSCNHAILKADDNDSRRGYQLIGAHSVALLRGTMQ